VSHDAHGTGTDRGETTAASRATTSAIAPSGRSIYFDDLVRDGEVVEVEGRRMVVRYDPAAPDWFVKPEPSAASVTCFAHRYGLPWPCRCNALAERAFQARCPHPPDARRWDAGETDPDCICTACGACLT